MLSLKIGMHIVKRILIDTRSSADILYWSTFKQMGGKASDLQSGVSPLIGLTGDTLQPRGVAQFKAIFGTSPRTVGVVVDFLVVSAPSTYNAILGRGTLNKISAIVSSPHLKIKFHTPAGIGEECGQQEVARECYMTSIQGNGGAVHQVDCSIKKRHKGIRQANEFMPPGTVLVLDPKDSTNFKGFAEPVDEVEQVEAAPGKFLNVGKAIGGEARTALINFLCENISVFAWSLADMPGIPRHVAEHKLCIKIDAKPVRQKRRNMGPERRLAVQKEVEKLLVAGFICPVEHPEWLANPVLVKKSNGDWRMCIDYTDLNKAYPMDHFPMPKIDQLVDSTSGHVFLSFMDVFLGYNQIMMNKEDEEKTAFTTNFGLYCYRAMPFGLKNAGATF